MGIIRVMNKLIIFSMVFFMVGCIEEPEVLTLSTGTSGGTYYPIGGAIAQILTEKIEGVNINAVSGNASVANCLLIQEGNTDLALVQNNVAYWAYSGSDIFEGRSNDKIRGIASLYPEAVQIVVKADSEIYSVSDLKGKRVGVGLEGSGVYVDAMNVLNAYGMAPLDIEAVHLNLHDARESLLEGNVDVAFVTSGYPTSSITSIEISEPIRLIPIESSVIQEMIEALPYYSETIIPAGTYASIKEDTRTITTMAMLIASSDLDEDLVYEMTKSFWESQEALMRAHEKSAEITMDTALNGMGIPLHNGAKRYYDEQLQ